MRKNKRIIATILCVAILLLLTNNAFAESLCAHDSKAAIGCSGIRMMTEETYENIFSLSHCQDQRINEIAYSYEITSDGVDDSVLLTFYLPVEDCIIPVKAVGIIQRYEFGKTALYEGPLFGTFRYDANEYDVTVGFMKDCYSSEIQAGVTITEHSQEESIENNLNNSLVFAFGDFHFILFEDESLNNEYIDTSKNVMHRSNPYVVRSVNSVGCGGNVAGYGQILYTMFDSSSNRVAVSIKTFASNVDNFYSNLGYVNTSISECSYNLSRVNSSDHSYIAGIESFDFPTGDYNNGAVLVESLFSDILSIFGVPMATITSLFSNIRGEVSLVGNTNNTTVSLKYGLNQSIDYDNLSYGVPIVFQLDMSGSYTASSQYTASSTVKYRAAVIPNGYPDTVYFYVNSNNASSTISISLTQ